MSCTANRKRTFGIWHCSVSSFKIHRGGFSINSKQLVLSENLMCENLIFSSLYCKPSPETWTAFVSPERWVDKYRKYSQFLAPVRIRSDWKIYATSRWCSWCTIARMNWRRNFRNRIYRERRGIWSSLGPGSCICWCGSPTMRRCANTMPWP